MKRSDLRADPEKVAAWRARSQEKARQRARDRPPVPPGRKKARVPNGTRAEVYARHHGACVGCLAACDGLALGRVQVRRLMREGAVQRAVQVHHVLAEREFPDLAKVADNLVGVCPECHMNHEFSARSRLPLAAVASAMVLVTTGARRAHIDRHYRP